MSPCGMNLAIRICFVTTLSSAFHLKADWFAQPWQLLSDFIPEFSTTTKKNLPKLSSCYLLRSSSCCLQSPHDDIKCESDADVRGWSPHGFFWLDSYGANIIRQIGFCFFFPTCINKLCGELLPRFKSEFERFALMLPERHESTWLGCVLNQNFCNSAIIISYDGRIHMISGAGGCS